MKVYKRRIISLLTITILLLALLVFSGSGFASDDNDKFGGTLRYAVYNEPAHIDGQITTSGLVNIFAQHIYEALFAVNSKYQPVPHLAENYEVENEGKLIVIHLREGVLFHNGKEMTSEDVVASLNRWGEYSGYGKNFYGYLEKIESVDKYTVNLHFKEPYGPWAFILAAGKSWILPKEIMENADGKPIAKENYIGTGPYKFVGWESPRYILLERFGEYVARDEEPDYYAGRRVAYFDKIRFVPVGDAVTRVNAVLAGEYDYADKIPGNFYTQLEGDTRIVNLVASVPQTYKIHINTKEGIFKDNYKLRQAILAALDMGPILSMGLGADDLWKLECSLTMAESSMFYSKAGCEKYDQGDSEKAKRLAEEAGYKGEKIVFMVVKDHPIIYNCSQVISNQLSAAGFNIDSQIFDRATHNYRRGDPELWNMFFTGSPFYPEPTLNGYLMPDYYGWWNTDKQQELLNQLINTIDPEERVVIWNKIQALVYEEVPIILIGGGSHYNITSPKLQAIDGKVDENVPFPFFWNKWFK